MSTFETALQLFTYIFALFGFYFFVIKAVDFCMFLRQLHNEINEYLQEKNK